MTGMNRRQIGGRLAAFSALGAGLLTPGLAAAQSAKTLNGAGATFPAVLYSKWSEEYLKATGLQINYQAIGSGGGIKALGGAPIEMVFGDARSTPDGGVAEVEKMQAEGVLAIVGGFASPICLAASQAASRYDLPYIVDVGVSDQIVTRGLTNTFRFGPGFGTVTASALDNLVQIHAD